MLRLSFPVLLLLLASCNRASKPIVENILVDSILQKASLPAKHFSKEAELDFWSKRIQKAPGGLVNQERYAYALESQFHQNGDIQQLLTADSILSFVNNQLRSSDAGILRSMARLAISRHQFDKADNLIQQALSLGSEKYNSTLMQFDAAFELGHYNWAAQVLKKLYSTNDFGYYFRRARWFHYEAAHDSSIFAMQQAAQLAEGNTSLRSAALSNLGDLYLHFDKADQAYASYLSTLEINARDIHSLLGIGSIALLHDGNDSTAEKIFLFCMNNTAAPEPILKMKWIAEQRQDKSRQLHFAGRFLQIVNQPAYGDMYNKYVIDICTGVIKDNQLAKAAAEREIALRPTAQSYAWYAWALFHAGEKEKAASVFETKVSGKPLEALELYFMGMMLNAEGRKSLAKKYLVAALKNQYDLGPSKIKDIENILDQ